MMRLFTRHKRRHRSREEENSSSAEDDFDASAIYGSGVRRRPGPASMTPRLDPRSSQFASHNASALAARLPPGMSVSSLGPERSTREPMVVNDVSSSDNDIIHEDDDSDIVLDDIVAKKPPEKPSAQTFTSMVAHSLPLLPSNSGETSLLAHKAVGTKEAEAFIEVKPTVLNWDLEDDHGPMDQEVSIGQVDGIADLDSGDESVKDNEMDVSGDLEGEVVEGGEEEEEELDAAATQHEPVDEDDVQPDVEGNHQEELHEENLVGESVEDDEPMVQNHQPDGLAELVSNLGVDVEGIDVGVAEEGLDLEGGDEQDFEYENNQGEEDLVGEEYQDYIEGDQVGEVYEGDEGEEGHQAYYDEEQDEDDEAYNEEEGEFYQGYGQSQAKKPKMQEQEEEVVLESSDDEESSAPAVKPQPAQHQQWPMQQRIQQAQFGFQVQQQQPLHQQQARAPMPPAAQFGLQQLHHQSMYADLLHSRGQQQFHPHQFAPMQRKRRPPTALCIKDGRVFLRPFTAWVGAGIAASVENISETE